MVNSVDIRALVPLPALSGPELAGTQLTVGEIVRARVMERGAPGQPVLMLGGATLAMELPFPVTPGQSLDFTVLEVKPEVRLGVQRPAPSNGQPTPGGDPAPELQISPEALLLSRVTGRLAAADTPPPLPLQVALPGAEGETLLQEPRQLAMALRQGVDRSGLFYERHLAQWVSGQRDAERLRQEPQAGWPGERRRGAAPDLAARLIAAAPEDGPAGMVRQQIETLQQQALVMRSEVAPGFLMDWRLQVEEDGQRRQGEPESRRWAADVSSEVGSLKRVEAHLSLAGDRLQLSLRAEGDALARMGAGRQDLESALVAAGLQLVALRLEPLPAAAEGEA